MISATNSSPNNEQLVHQVAHLTASINASPKDEVLYNTRGTLYFSLQKYEEALSDFNKCLSLNAHFYPGYYNRSILYQFSTIPNADLAVLNMTKAIQNCAEMHFKAEFYRARGLCYKAMLNNCHKAIEDLGSSIALTSNPLFKSVTFCLRGQLKEVLKDIDSALEDYDKAIDMMDDNSSAYQLRAMLYKNGFKYYKNALSDLDKAIELYHSFKNRNTLAPMMSLAFLHNTRGLLYKTFLKDPNKAINDFDRALSLKPNDSAVLFNRATTYEQLKLYDQAIMDFSLLLKTTRQGDFSKRKLSILYNRRGMLHYYKRNYEDSLKDFTAAIELDTSNHSAFSNRAVLQYDGFMNAEYALGDFAAALAQNSKDDEVLHNRGLLYESLNQVEKAKQDYEAALSINKENKALEFSYHALLRAAEAQVSLVSAE